MIRGSPGEDPHSEKNHHHASTALHGSSGLNPYVGHSPAAKLVFALQRPHLLAKATGMFEQAHKQVAQAAPCLPLQDTEDSVGLSSRHITQGCMKRSSSPAFTKGPTSNKPPHHRTASNSWSSQSSPVHFRFLPR